MTQIEIFSGYKILPDFENEELQIIDYNKWGMQASKFIPKSLQRLLPPLVMTAPLFSGTKKTTAPLSPRVFTF